MNFGALAQVNEVLEKNKPHIIEALYAFEKGDIKKSEKIFIKLLKFHPRNPVFLYNMGNIKLVRNQNKLAVHYYKLVVSLKSPLSPAAKIYMSKALHRLGRYKDAIKYLGEALESKIADSLYNLASDELDKYKKYEEEFLTKANHQFESRDFLKAAVNYWYAWVINPTAETNLKLGHTYLLLNKYRKAEKYFYKIKDEMVFKQAEDLMYEYGILDKIQVTDEKRITLFFDYSSGSNSNPNTQSETEEFASDSETVISFGGDYSFFIRKNFTARVGLEGFSDSFKSDPSTKSTGLGFLLPLSYSTDNFDLNIITKRENTTYGGEDYIRNSTLNFNHIYYFRTAKTNISYTYTKYDALETDYDYLNGNGHIFEAYYTYLFPRFDFTLGYIWGEERLNDNDSSIGSNHNQAFEAAVFIPLADKVSFSLSTNYLISKYLQDSSGFAQNDVTWTSFATLTFALRDYISLYGRYRYIKNNSNVKSESLDYNYTQGYLALGASFFLNF